jgi:formamidopyrimidine-DNA glycosylase
VPELPEIQAHAERLTEAFAGSRLERFEPLTFTALKTVVPGPREAVGRLLGGVGRRGKHLLLDFGGTGGTDSTGGIGADTRLTFVVHLMQGGRLVPDDKLSARPRNGIARWRLAGAPCGAAALLLTEAGTERKAGVWVLAGDPLGQAPLSGLGPDADTVDAVALAGRLAASRNQRLHGWLRDQSGVAGIGRMLANEICHRAKLSPFAMTAKLTDDQRAALHDAVQACIAEALAHERTLDAMSKSADRPGAVHRRKGAACPVCGDTVRAVEYSAYEVDYCPTCQTGGKVLADNTTSKFLR